jgi:hypothetical protein
MARRLSQIASLLDGFNAGYDTVSRIARDRDLREVATAKPTTDTGFTQADGDQLRAAAESGQYDVAWDAERGQYTVAPKAAPDMVGNVTQKERTQFLGQTYDQPLDDAGVSRARSLAMAGVLEKHGDPTAGVRMRDTIRQGDIAEEGLKLQRKRAAREDEAAPLQLSALQRGERQAQQQEDDTTLMRNLDTEVGDWFKGRLAGPDGTARAAKIEDHLAASQYRAAKLVEAGKVDAAGKVMADYNAQAFTKINLETAQRNDALVRTAAAFSAGDMGAVKDFYNTYVPDGAKVVDVKRGPKGEIVIARESDDGRPMAPVTMQDTGQMLAALNSFKDPMALYQWSQAEFKNNLAVRADRRAEASAGREAATFNAGAPARELSQTLSKLQVERLNPNTTPARRAEIDTLLTQNKGADANEPADVKVARALMAAGAAPDMQTALNYALNNPDKVHKAFVDSGLKNMMKPAEAVSQADEVMRQMGYTKRGSAWSMAGAAPAGATAVPPAAQRKVGQAYDTPQGKMIWRGTGWEPAPK